MKNLTVNCIFHNELNSDSAELCCIIDSNLCFYNDCGLLALEYNASVGNVHAALRNAGPNAELVKPAYLGYSGISKKAVVAFSSGDIVSVDISEGTTGHEGTIEPGILAGSWSPGEDLLAFVSTQLSLVILDTEFDIVFETDLHQQSLEQPVAVGWGKKETQFRGTEGKLKVGATVPEFDCVNVTDDGKVRMSWRGDGEYLAVSVLLGNQRFIKIVSKDGQLVHSSEVVTGLESALDWRPNGSLIASSQRLPNKHVICFFEKNTLSHGQFELRGDWNVRELVWSLDSSVLAAILDGLKTQIHLFASSNYHWYHKYSIVVAEGEKLIYAAWDSSEALMLHVIISNGKVLRHIRYSWRWTVDCSSGASSNDEAFVSVIDGARLLITSFRRGIVPPPMSSYVMECPKPINAVGFAQFAAVDQTLSSNDLFIQQNDGTLSFYKFNTSSNKHDCFSELLLENQDIFQLSWISRDIILGCRALTNGKHQLCIVRIPKNKSELIFSYVDVEQPLAVIRRRTEGLGVLLCSFSLKFFSYDMVKKEVEEFAPADVPKCKGKILAVEMRHLPLVLDSSSTLFSGCEELCSGVTSIHLYDDIVLATTLKHKLLCVPLTNPTAATERAVEPGARLVTVIPGTGKVVLQMPRGNLEVVQPRALALRTLQCHLEKFKYGEAFSIMRRERINLNLLCDHNLDHFAAHIDQFLDALMDSTALCNFIAELMPENVTRTIYGAFFSGTSPRFDSHDKVKRICSSIISAVDKRSDAGNFFLVSLSCFVKIDDPGSALLRIKKAIDAEHSGAKSAVSGTEGLKHVMYLIDIEQLFKVALSTYDLDLVMFIASKSQKDPKEYVPFLSNLDEMEVNYQKFTIDKFLKRYDRALEHLVKCSGKLVEFLELVETQKLYKKALTLFKPNSEGYKAVCLIYGEELLKQKRHDEEGAILLQGGHTKLAMFAFLRSGNWRQVLFCANTLNYTAEQLSDLCKNLVGTLRNEKRYEDVAKLLLSYTEDVSGAVEALSSAHLFEEAMQVCKQYGKEVLIDHVKKVALETAENLAPNICSLASTFKQQAERLKAVRLKKLDEVDVDWDDMQSESSRGSSRGSKSTSTSRSAKNSRKLERKVLSLKEGGAFEDLALIASMHDLATQAVAFIPQVRSINLFLMVIGEFGHASALQSALRAYFNVISMLIPEIWRPVGGSDESATSNSIAASWANRTQSAMPIPVQAIQPKLLFAPNISSSTHWEFGILQSDSSP